MSQKKLKRGFKSYAERKSSEIRNELKLSPVSPLRSEDLANHFEVPMFGLSDIAHIYDENLISRLLVEDSGSWSAATIPHPNGDFIVYNSSHTKKRQESDLMHEFSHIICGHECVKLDLSTFGLPLRSYNDEIEEEAKWMGATLQLPREALIWALKKSMTDDEISDYFTATLEMVRFRKIPVVL